MRVDFLDYGSDDCPLIRFYATEQRSFVLLHRELDKLANGVAPFQRLHDDAAFEMADDLYLILIAGENRGANRLDNKKFSWELTQAQWSLVAGLVEPFTEDSQPGRFQWLAGPESRYGLDTGDIAVLLSCSAEGSW